MTIGLTGVSFFSGIGGFELGFARAGIRTLAQIENDPVCRSILEWHFPDVDRSITDVRHANRDNLPIADVYFGGFPCQDVSVAGRREGLAGKRSGLWFEFHRIIAEVKPEWVVIENVPGLLSSNGGRDMGAVVGGLAELGYWWAYRVLDAQFFGVPQRRRRVFIVASLTRGCPQKVLFERQSSPWDTSPGREAGKDFAVAITERTRTGGMQLEYQDDIAYALDNPGNGGRTQTRLIAFGGNNTAGATSMAPAVNAHGSRRYDFESEPFVCNAFNGYTGGSDDNDAQANHLVRDSRNLVGVRRLTPVECERLQGFPDGWTEGQADSSRYRQLGNAVAVPVAEWIGKRLMEMLFNPVDR